MSRTGPRRLGHTRRTRGPREQEEEPINTEERVGKDMRTVTEEKVMKIVAVLSCVVGASAVLYVDVYARYVLREPIDEDLFRRYWAVFVIGMALVWVGAGFAWPRRHRGSEQEEDAADEEGREIREHAESE